MQGRLLMFQEQPFEVQTNYAGSGALRCNFDVQDLRRVLPESLWKLEEEASPSLPVDEARAKEIGYMGVYEWDGEDFVTRAGDASSREPTQWVDEKTREQWRQAFLAALATDHGGQDAKPFKCRECGAPHHKDLGEAGHPCQC